MYFIIAVLIAFEPRSSDLHAVRNAYLFYTDVYRSKYLGEYTTLEGFITPYVFYEDGGDKPDRFFDSFILIDHFTYYNNSMTATKDWWSEYVKRVFGSGTPRVVKVFHGEPGGNRAFAIQVRESCLYRLFDGVQDDRLSLSFSARVLDGPPFAKAGYVGFKFFDDDRREIKRDVRDLEWSEYLGIWYRYVDLDTVWRKEICRIDMPRGTAYVSTYIGSWLADNVAIDDVIWRSGTVARCENFEDDDLVWQASYVPRLALSDEYTRIIPRIDSILEHHPVSSVQDRTLNMILTIPWSYRTSDNRDFGVINGRRLDLSLKDDALAAVMWFIDECLANWRKIDPENLRLAGFYWLNEEGNDFQMVELSRVARYVHQKGYLLFGSCFNSLWEKLSFGPDYFRTFDCVWLQPNAWPAGYRTDADYLQRVARAHARDALSADPAYVKQRGIPLSELSDIDVLAESLNAGIVIEWVPGQEQISGYGRVMDYLNLDRAHDHDFSNKKTLVFDERGFGQYCCRSVDSVFRRQYDAAYRFIAKNRSLLE